MLNTTRIKDKCMTIDKTVLAAVDSAKEVLISCDVFESQKNYIMNYIEAIKCVSFNKYRKNRECVCADRFRSL